MNEAILEWIKVVGTLLFSLPFLGLIILILFYKHFTEILQGFNRENITRLKSPIFEIERRIDESVTALDRTKSLTDRINVKMLESRRLELEMLKSGPLFQLLFQQIQDDDLKREWNENFEDLLKLEQEAQQEQTQTEK